MPNKKKLFTATYSFDGKRYYIRSSKSQRDADRKAAKAFQERQDGYSLITEDITVWDYALRWVETYKSCSVSIPVYKAYKQRVANYIIPAIGPMRMRDVRATNLQELMNKQEGKSKDFYIKLLATIQSVFKQAIRDDIIRKDPSEAIYIPKAVNGTNRSLTTEERSAILNVAQSNRFGLAVKLMLFCGLRPQEAVALKWIDIDQINKRLMIRRALKNDGSIGEPKSSAGNRDIPIPPILWSDLHITDHINPNILTAIKGGVYTRTSLRCAWESFKKDVDILMGAKTITAKNGVVMISKSVLAPDLVLYCLRHTYCTDLESAGVPINVAKYLMGHSDISLTAKIYTHMRDDTLAAAADKISALGATVSATQKTIFAVNDRETTGANKNLKATNQ